MTIRSGVPGKLGILRLKGKAKSALRAKVFLRDEMTCQRCGCGVSDYVHDLNPRKAHLAHKQGVGAGGSDTEENTECACRDCHMVIEHGGGKPCPAK